MIGLATGEEESERRPEDTGGHLRVVGEEQSSGHTGSFIRKLNRFINYVFVIIEALILLRILLKVLGGNSANSFVSFIYGLTDPFVSPFLSAFNLQAANTGIGVIEFGAILAIAFYVLLNYAIVKLLWIIVSRR